MLTNYRMSKARPQQIIDDAENAGFKARMVYKQKRAGVKHP